MSAWTSGYVSDIPYSSGFYRELSPNHLAFSGLAFGQVPGPTRRYLELGCGQGFGLALLAAANPDILFHGIDFNPEHIVAARRIASEAGLANVTFEEASFEETAAEPVGERFDTIALHGILSWVSDEAQDAIVSILSRRLAPGGLVYVSYNCLPGWSAMAPLQALMRTLAARQPSGRSDVRVDAALKALDGLKTAGARYFSANPSLAPRMEKLPGLGRAYLAHEYLNQHWRPLYFTDVETMFQPAKLNFLGSATLTENIDAIAVPKDMSTMVSEAGGDVGWRETLRDYAANKQFRRDIFGRGLPGATPREHAAALNEARFVLAQELSGITYKIQGPLGDIEAHQAIYRPIVEHLSETDIASFQEIAALPALAEKGRGAALQAVTLLVHSGQVLPIVEATPSDRDAARRFNRHVVSSFERGRVYGHLASPVAGTGFAAGTADLLALSALQAGRTDMQSLARHAFDLLLSLGQRPVRDGRAIENDAEALDHLVKEVGPVVARKSRIWKRLGVI